ncbi:MAG: ABC-ATPase domain-containing protein [Candidatus Aminicenantales bacterium]
MKTRQDLEQILARIDGKGYKAYRDLGGAYDCGDYTLHIDHVQSDPFAPPSRVRIRMPQSKAGFPPDTYRNKSREKALRDFITRKFHAASRIYSKGKRGSGKSGLISINQPSQEILERTSAFVTDSYVEVRFGLGLPAFGRRIAAREAESMLLEEIPDIVDSSLRCKNLDKHQLQRHIETSEDADFLRQSLEKLGLVAFVAEAAILPRASGVDPRPLSRGRVVPFKSPDSLRVSVILPNRGKVTGMGIPEGITLIVGGGYHGKSTLLRALETGIYNHIPGDGREFVVTVPNAVKIRAEDGRRIEKVDISPFISNLPLGQKTDEFSTDDASGSTSQAANIIEALEMGASLLLIDEDTSATNFMIRDHRMQELVSKDKEPITPFIDKVRQLYQDFGVSTILVIGGSGDYFDAADRVICMVDYRPQDMTQEAKKIAAKYKAERKAEGGKNFGKITRRIPLAHSFRPNRGRKKVKIAAKGLTSLLFGHCMIDLRAIEQLVDISQTKTIGDAIYYSLKYMDGEKTLKEVLNLVMKDVREKGLDVLSPYPTGDYAEFRSMELGAAVNRLRTLSIHQKKM